MRTDSTFWSLRPGPSEAGLAPSTVTPPAAPTEAGPNAVPGSPATARTLAPAREQDRIDGFGVLPPAIESTLTEVESLAKNRDEFHQRMSVAFGERAGWDVVERLRSRILSGDRSWVPASAFVSRSDLRGAEAAYAASSGSILLAEDLAKDGKAAKRAFAEELGHHLDHLLGPGDARGDEGEIFARVLAGDSFAPGELGRLRSENDHGVVRVDGRPTEVEFFFKKAFKKISGVVEKGVKGITDVIDKGADAIGGVIDGGLHAVGKFVSPILKPVVGVLDRIAPYIAFLPGIGTSLVTAYMGVKTALAVLQGRSKEALRNLFTSLASWGASSLLSSSGLGRWANDLVGGFGRTVQGVVDDSVAAVIDIPGSVARNAVQAAASFLRGDASGGWRSLGGTILEPLGRSLGFGVNVGARLARGLADFAGKVTGIEPLARRLLPAELQRYAPFFGDTVDLSSVRIQRDPVGGLFGMRAHVVGNTIYLPPTSSGQVLFTVGGSLTAEGRDVLDHEMAHVWQNQNVGGRYLYESLWAQAKAALGFGDGSATPDSNDAYRWREALRSGLPLADLNPEAQAEIVREMLHRGIGLSSMEDFVAAEVARLGDLA